VSFTPELTTFDGLVLGPDGAGNFSEVVYVTETVAAMTVDVRSAVGAALSEYSYGGEAFSVDEVKECPPDAAVLLQLNVVVDVAAMQAALQVRVRMWGWGWGWGWGFGRGLG
jgi:hypothetical protein